MVSQVQIPSPDMTEDIEKLSLDELIDLRGRVIEKAMEAEMVIKDSKSCDPLKLPERPKLEHARETYDRNRLFALRLKNRIRKLQRKTDKENAARRQGAKERLYLAQRALDDAQAANTPEEAYEYANIAKSLLGKFLGYEGK
jgi:hypothetical protein